MYPEAVAVLPKGLNLNTKAFLSIQKDLFEIRTPPGIELEKVTSLIVVDTNRWVRLDQIGRPDAAEQMIFKLISGNQPASIQISDLMSYPFMTVSPETRIEEVCTVLQGKGYMGIPGMDDGRLVASYPDGIFGEQKDVDIKCPGEGAYYQRCNHHKPGEKSKAGGLPDDTA